MLYLESFDLPGIVSEGDVLTDVLMTCYTSFYPFGIFPRMELEHLSFEPVTILYGSNGCGKSTLLNVIASCLELKRDCSFNRSEFFDAFTERCEWTLREELPSDSRMITSDDVFDYILNIRALNEGVDQRRSELFDEYLTLRHSKFRMSSMEDYDRLKTVNNARKRTASDYLRDEMNGNVREHSNGENAWRYFLGNISDEGLYLLDEPENSLSPAKILELGKFIEDSARFCSAQFIISTHSPFLLSMKGARIYDLDEVPVRTRKWTELGNVRTYRDFFLEHEKEFEGQDED